MAQVVQLNRAEFPDDSNWDGSYCSRCGSRMLLDSKGNGFNTCTGKPRRFVSCPNYHWWRAPLHDHGVRAL